MMMSRNSVTSYFCKSLKGSYPIHSHRYKSGSNFTKVIELHKTKISEGRIRPKGSIQVVKGKKVSPPAGPVHPRGGQPQPPVLAESLAPACVLSHNTWQLCSCQKLAMGSETTWEDGAVPREAAMNIRSLNFTAMPTHVGQSQAKVQGCFEPVCLDRLLTHRLLWIS